MRNVTYHVDGCPATIALLCDLHDRPAARVLSNLQRNRPDVIAVAGDFVNKLGDSHSQASRFVIEDARNAMDLLTGCAQTAPTFVSLGNHEWMLGLRDIVMIENAGCRVLNDCWTRHGPLVVGGLSSGIVSRYQQWRESQPDPIEYARPPKDAILMPANPRTDWLDAFCAEGGYHVLLCHHPEYWPSIRERPIELVLSGHAHGGQWRYPSVATRRWEGVFAPGQGLFPRLTSGVHEGRLVISKGLSNTAPVPRFFNPTEIVYVRSR